MLVLVIGKCLLRNLTWLRQWNSNIRSVKRIWRDKYFLDLNNVCDHFDMFSFKDRNQLESKIVESLELLSWNKVTADHNSYQFCMSFTRVRYSKTFRTFSYYLCFTSSLNHWVHNYTSHFGATLAISAVGQ